jgi:hypothetical protein
MAAAGRTAAKVLGINLDYRKEEPVSGAASISSVETCECILLLLLRLLVGTLLTKR